MTKYKTIEINTIRGQRNGNYLLFDKEVFEKLTSSNEGMANYANYEHLEFGPCGEIHYGTGVEELFETHRGLIGDIYCSIEEPVKEIFISTTGIALELHKSKIEEILKKTNYPTSKKIFGNITIKSGELIIYSMESSNYTSIKVPNGTHPIYEIYDKSYLDNIEEEESIMNNEKQNEDEDSWIPRKDFSPTDPNIHFLYFDFKQNK
jgi:hypothetical protein